MSTEENKSLVRRYYEQVANATTPEGATTGADQLLTNDFTFFSPSDTEGDQGLENHKGFLIWHHGVAPDQHWTPAAMVAEGERVAVRFVMHGTQQGEFLGIPPTGKPFTMHGMDMFRVEQGRIAELRRYFDMMTIMEQLRAEPKPEQMAG